MVQKLHSVNLCLSASMCSVKLFLPTVLPHVSCYEIKYQISSDSFVNLLFFPVPVQPVTQLQTVGWVLQQERENKMLWSESEKGNTGERRGDRVEMKQKGWNQCIWEEERHWSSLLRSLLWRIVKISDTFWISKKDTSSRQLVYLIKERAIDVLIDLWLWFEWLSTLLWSECRVRLNQVSVLS